MSKVIRVDAEVFQALQRLAAPLVDNANDVLRRLLNLDAKEQEMPAQTKSPRSDSGRRINERYKLGAKHALYHIDGTFYELLEHFPGFLADASGYVWYANEDDFRNDAYLDIQDKVHVLGELSQHPNYQEFPQT